MSTTPPQGPQGGPRPKTRDDDERGAKPGQQGNQPFVPTEAMRQKARTLAQAHSEHSETFIAAQMGISRSTLLRHFADDMTLGRAELVANAGAQMISKALRGSDAVNPETGKLLAPGDIEALKFLLARRGWNAKVEVGGRNGRPIETVDLSRLSPEQLEEYGRLAAIAEGLDPEDVVGRADDTA